MRNPLEVVFCWQTLVIALGAFALTELIKCGIDYALAPQRDTLRVAFRSGADVRRQHPLLSQVAMPLVPVVCGLLLAVVLPLRPDPLTAFFAARDLGPTDQALYAALWGVVCGVISDYLYGRFREPVRTLKNQRAG